MKAILAIWFGLFLTSALLGQSESKPTTENTLKVFESVCLRDPELTVIAKMKMTKLASYKYEPGPKAHLPVGWEWRMSNQMNFEIRFEYVKGLLGEFTLKGKSRRADLLDATVHEEWVMLRRVAIERYGPPTRTRPYPDVTSPRNTDEWELPERTVKLAVWEDEALFYPELTISDNALMKVKETAAQAARDQAVKKAASGL